MAKDDILRRNHSNLWSDGHHPNCVQEQQLCTSSLWIRLKQTPWTKKPHQYYHNQPEDIAVLRSASTWDPSLTPRVSARARMLVATEAPICLRSFPASSSLHLTEELPTSWLSFFFVIYGEHHHIQPSRSKKSDSIMQTCQKVKFRRLHNQRSIQSSGMLLAMVQFFQDNSQLSNDSAYRMK